MLEVSRVSSATGEWKSAAEAGLAEAEALRRHAQASSAALQATREEARRLADRLERSEREKSQLRRQADALKRVTQDLSQDLDEASVQLTLADGAARGRAWADFGAADEVHSPGRPDRDLGDSFEGDDTELQEALHEAPSGGHSELSQLDRDIQTLKASLRAMLGSGYTSSVDSRRHNAF